MMKSEDLQPLLSPRSDRRLSTEGGSILIAEDNEDHRDSLTYLLSRDGYDVRSASSGEQAIEMALSKTPDLVILDVDMPPGMDGFATCRLLHELCSPPPSVLFLSAHANSDHAVRGLDVGAFDYIGKPYDYSELTARVRAALRVRREIHSLRSRVLHDPLTGAMNRGELDPQLSTLIALGERHRRPFSCLMVDVDRFKSINDRFGHLNGDLVLKEVSRRIQEASREADLVLRYGGEEFIILAPETKAPQGLALANRLRKSVERERVSLSVEEGQDLEQLVTISIGVAEWSPGLAADDLVRAADRAMYRAKQLGRNRVCLHRDP